MAYNNFAYWYDSLNSQANYDRLSHHLISELQSHGIAENSLVADLGCGTGELSIRLAEAGYDLICVDASADMLTVFREKLTDLPDGTRQNLLLLCQDLVELDLYGTIRAAVSTFDTLNHLSPADLENAIQRISLFLEPGGLFVFDVNTPYKHREVLGSHSFDVEGRHVQCRWTNQYHPENGIVQIGLTGFDQQQLLFTESFVEYSHSLEELTDLLQVNQLRVASVLDGESFCRLTEISQRYCITAIKDK